MIEASGSGFVPLTNESGSESRRPKTYGSDGSGSATLDKKQATAFCTQQKAKPHLVAFYVSLPLLLALVPRLFLLPVLTPLLLPIRLLLLHSTASSLASSSFPGGGGLVGRLHVTVLQAGWKAALADGAGAGSAGWRLCLAGAGRCAPPFGRRPPGRFTAAVCTAFAGTRRTGCVLGSSGRLPA